MVVSISHDVAFRFLDEHGYVAVFRASRREQRNQDDWCDRGRGESEGFDVHVQEVAHVDIQHPALDSREWIRREGNRVLEDFASISGFETRDDWLDAIEAANDGLPEEGWVYLVTVTDGGDD